MKRKKLSKAAILAVDQLYFLLGCLCYAAAINIFALPNQIAQSGFSGVAIILNHVLNVPIGLMYLALNVPMLIAAWIGLGWRFVSKTVLVTIMMSAMLDIFPLVLSFEYTDDKLLASLFCGALTGVGLSLIFARGATSGGTDILGALVTKHWAHISIGRVILMADSFVIAAAAAVFRDINAALYAAIVIFISSRVIDSVIYGINNGKLFYIFSDKYEEISAAIIKKMQRGVSILPARGGFSGLDKPMLLCAVRRSEVSRLRRLLRDIDSESFLIIAEAQDIFGAGFKEH